MNKLIYIEIGKFYRNFLQKGGGRPFRPNRGNFCCVSLYNPTKNASMLRYLESHDDFY